jgi:hypothetical protein
LWATNNGHDRQGSVLPPEVVYIVRDGAFYGWPLAYAYQIYVDLSVVAYDLALAPLTRADSLLVQRMPLTQIGDPMSNPSISCFAVSGTVDDLGAAHPHKYSACQALPLKRFWDGPDALPQESGTTYIGAAQEGLSFYVLLDDSDIFSTATGDDQRMWTLGDVAEFFIKPGVERTDYWEIHITPNDYIMDIHIPDREKFMAGDITWDQVIAPSSHTAKRVAVLDGQWVLEIVIPWKTFDLDAAPAAGTVWQFAVCRYNYNNGLEDPEHSSTAHLSEPGFHNYEEFTDLVF